MMCGRAVRRARTSPRSQNSGNLTAGAEFLAAARIRVPRAAGDGALLFGGGGTDDRWGRRRLVRGTVVEERNPAPVESAIGGRVPLAAQPYPFLARVIGIDDPRVHEVIVLPPEGIVRVVVAAGRAAAIAVAVEA